MVRVDLGAGAPKPEGKDGVMTMQRLLALGLVLGVLLVLCRACDAAGPGGADAAAVGASLGTAPSKIVEKVERPRPPAVKAATYSLPQEVMRLVALKAQAWKTTPRVAFTKLIFIGLKAATIEERGLQLQALDKDENAILKALVQEEQTRVAAGVEPDPGKRGH
jgi:hypothetical protein